MGKKVYWIDDCFEIMFGVVQGIIRLLWDINDDEGEVETGISSKILFFGNGEAMSDIDSLADTSDLKYSFEKIYNYFLEECLKFDGPKIDRPVFNRKKSLIEEPVGFVFRKDNDNDLKEYKVLKSYWIDMDFLSKDDPEYIKANEKTIKLIKKMEISNESVIGIDAMLLFGDQEKIMEKKLTISMDLCHQLISDQRKVFIYSTNADIAGFSNNWQETYKQFFDQEAPKIYVRQDFFADGDFKIYQEIKDLIQSI